MAKRTKRNWDGVRFITYNWNDTGYRVEVWQAERLIHSYDAGNNPKDSQSYVSEERVVGVEQLGKWAEQTALELATEYKVKPGDVTRDEDMMVNLPADA